MDPLDLRLDGNAAGGLLLEIFGREMTGNVTTCNTCRAEHPLGRLLVYTHGMGTVLRCASCGGVQMKIAAIRGEYTVDLRGVHTLHLRRAG
jgi:hypothetical protein